MHGFVLWSVQRLGSSVILSRILVPFRLVFHYNEVPRAWKTRESFPRGFHAAASWVSRRRKITKQPEIRHAFAGYSEATYQNKFYDYLCIKHQWRRVTRETWVQFPLGTCFFFNFLWDVCRKLLHSQICGFIFINGDKQRVYSSCYDN